MEEGLVSTDEQRSLCSMLRIKHWIYLFFSFGLLMLLAVAQHYAIAGADSVTIILLPSLLLAWFPWDAEAQLYSESVPTIEIRVAQSDAAPSTPKPRYYYLDNIKSALTFIVVLHHLACAYGDAGTVISPMLGNQDVWSSRMAIGFASANQGYFMSLFAFISGYFTPKSHSRKGTREFIKDKLIRYGTPFLIYFWCLNPLCWVWEFLMFWPNYHEGWSYVPGEGPPWFLRMLLVLNTWYVVCPSPPLRLKLPPLGILVLAGACIGVLQGWYIAFGLSTLGIPLATGALPFDVVFFFSGCVASRDDWLADLMKWSRYQLVWLYTIAVSLLLFNLIGVAYLTPYPMDPACLPISPPPPPPPPFGDTLSPEGRRLAPAPIDTSALAYNVWGSGAGMGVYTVTFSLTVLHFFATFMNYRNTVLDFLSQAAYGVYILHFVLLGPAVYAYTRVLEATGQPITFTYCVAKGAWYSMTPFDQESKR